MHSSEWMLDICIEQHHERGIVEQGDWHFHWRLVAIADVEPHFERGIIEQYRRHFEHSSYCNFSAARGGSRRQLGAT